MTFAAKLKALREEKGLTQEQLATAAVIPIGTLRDYEQGKRRDDPALSTAVKLARALGVGVEVFADCVEDGPEKPARKPIVSTAAPPAKGKPGSGATVAPSGRRAKPKRKG
jgi:transcriptional regulator with XRE-family HTH domain